MPKLPRGVGPERRLRAKEPGGVEPQEPKAELAEVPHLRPKLEPKT